MTRDAIGAQNEEISYPQQAKRKDVIFPTTKRYIEIGIEMQSRGMSRLRNAALRKKKKYISTR